MRYSVDTSSLSSLSGQMAMGLTWVSMMIEGLLMYSRDSFEELEAESKVRRAAPDCHM